MIGFETRIKEEESPFHKDIRPSFSIIYVHLLIIVPFFMLVLFEAPKMDLLRLMNQFQQDLNIL
jgi:hypothetical protein